MRKALVGLIGITLLGPGCDDDEAVSSRAEAEKAYKGLDLSVDKAIDLGFQGFNAARSANIDPQTANGTKTGTLTISGKVDQGTADNKNMTLSEAMVMFSDDGKVTYDTSTDVTMQPILTLSLKSYTMNGMLSGTLKGAFMMSGELKGTVTLDLAITGMLAYDGTTMAVTRAPMTTTIKGTAVSSAGTYQVDVTR